MTSTSAACPCMSWSTMQESTSRSVPKHLHGHPGDVALGYCCQLPPVVTSQPASLRAVGGIMLLYTISLKAAAGPKSATRCAALSVFPIVTAAPQVR